MNSETASETAFAAAADATNACTDCPICFEPMEGNSVCNWPGCSHQFCFNCVVTQAINAGIQRGNTNAAANHVNCPLCRGNFRGDNVAPPGVPSVESNIFGRSPMNTYGPLTLPANANEINTVTTQVNDFIRASMPIDTPPLNAGEIETLLEKFPHFRVLHRITRNR